VGCNNGVNHAFTARIVDISGTWITVEPIESDAVSRLSDRTSFGMDELDDIDISFGDIVSISFTGSIAYSVPTQIVATNWSLIERNGDSLLNNPHEPIVGNPNAPTISDRYQSFVGYVETVTFDTGNSGSGYLHLRGDAYESGVVPHVRVRLDEEITRSEISPSDLEIGQRVTVYHTTKGTAIWISTSLSDIRFIIEEWEGGADDAMEFIYADDLYRYYLSSIRSHLIMLTFDDGKRLSLNEALAQRKVNMDELIQNGLRVIRERIEPDIFSSDSGYEVGRIWLVTDGNEYEPGEHFLHGATNTEHGQLSASGIPFEFWLHNNLDSLPEIQYSTDMQIMIVGEFGRIVTSMQEHHTSLEGYELI